MNEKDETATTKVAWNNFWSTHRKHDGIKNERKRNQRCITYVPISANNPVMPGSTLPRGR